MRQQAPRPAGPRPRLARVLAGSASLYSSALAGITGIAFTLASLLLARALPVDEFAVVALAIALVTLGYTLAPLGLDRIVVRRDLPATPGLLRLGTMTSAAVAVCVAAAAFFLYDLGMVEIALIAPAILGGGLAYLAAGKLQSEKRFVLSMLVAQGANLLLLLAALIVAAAGGGGSALVLGLFTLGLVAIGAAIWTALLRRREPDGAEPVDWHEAMAITGTTALLILFATIERLLIPLMLTPAALAHFAVLAAMVVAPFRVLQMGMQRTMLPRLRDAASATQRRRLLRTEALVIGGVALAAGLVLWQVVPLVERLVLEGKYTTPPILLAITILVGVAKLLGGFSNAMVNALANVRYLYLANVLGWATLLLAVAAAWIGSRWGLSGLAAGTAFGTLCQAAAMFLIVVPQLRGR